MTREINCYVYDADDSRVIEYGVTIATKAGYTKPSVADMDKLEAELFGKLHKTEKSLRRVANSTPFDLDITVDERTNCECPEHLVEQQDQFDADSVRHLRR